MRHYRDIPKEKILKFKATPRFKGYEHCFTKDSVKHPAKMNLNLLRWILSTYTETNNVVLDPMAGTGSTIILAASMGRYGIAVEYEEKFCKLIEKNIGRTHQQRTFTPQGKMLCIKGDARALSKYLIESDVIISSPPYGNRLADVAIHDGDPDRMGYRQTVDIVLTSPPYAAAQSGGGIATKGYQGPKHTPTDLIGKRSYMPDKFENEDNISRLSYGDIDSIITSPPYEQMVSPKRGGDDPNPDLVGHPNINKGYSSDLENIGNLKGETYLEAMLQVYQECYKVLASQGKMVLVIKNFIRDKQVVRLDLDTIKLCESIGFNLMDRWYFDLPVKSFWKILYHQKYPKVDEVKYEDILVFDKLDVGVPPKVVKKQ